MTAQSESGTAFFITVSPKSSRSAITVLPGGEIKIFLTSPPVDGKANDELVALLSKTLHTAKSHIEIDKGAHGRKKRIVVHGMTQSEIQSAFERTAKK